MLRTEDIDGDTSRHAQIDFDPSVVWIIVLFQSLLAEGGSAEEAVDEASIVASQLAFARAVTGRAAEACERLKQIVRSRPSDSTVTLVSTTNLAALGGYKDPHEALKRYKTVC